MNVIKRVLLLGWNIETAIYLEITYYHVNVRVYEDKFSNNDYTVLNKSENSEPFSDNDSLIALFVWEWYDKLYQRKPFIKSVDLSNSYTWYCMYVKTSCYIVVKY